MVAYCLEFSFCIKNNEVRRLTCLDTITVKNMECTCAIDCYQVKGVGYFFNGHHLGDMNACKIFIRLPLPTEYQGSLIESCAKHTLIPASLSSLTRVRPRRLG